MTLYSVFSPSRSHYLSLAVFALLFNAFALYLQYGEGLQPCVTCIDIRVGLWGVFVFSMLASLKRSVSLLFAALSASCLFFSWYEIHQSLNSLYSPTGFLSACELRPAISVIIPIDDWLPALFGVKGMCGKAFWSFAGVELEVVKATFIAISLLAGYHIIVLFKGIISFLKSS